MRSKNNSKTNSSDSKNQESFFGFQRVSSKLKHSLVRDVFSSVADKYDLMNNVMSLGVHHLWKKEMLKLIPNHIGSLLDVAGGTGDISKLYYQRASQSNQNPDITICDFNLEMLKVGRANLIDENIVFGVNFVCGNALDLPFPDNSFGCYTIAFGIRNVVDINKALSEAFRVLKPGGKFICLEFSKVQSNLFAKIYELYSFNIIPILGEYIANDRKSYQYLVESINKFPKQGDFLKMIEKAGFKRVGYKNLSLGITALHYGYRS
ncbi:MAG: bifunctional demethylmenaquinone methyltransferase/2-methoxy-6-polyprenyl-1,4-benzoquinol methylase UbiE [Alphaproteobacteria bacterium]|jgi:ubiquinone/menaquinone biosynthesis methyltransferase